MILNHTGANVFMTSTARINSVPIANAIKRLLKGELSSISLYFCADLEKLMGRLLYVGGNPDGFAAVRTRH